MQERRRRQRRRRNIQIAVRLGMTMLAVGFIIFTAGKIIGLFGGRGGGELQAGNLLAAGLAKSDPVKIIETPPEYDVQLLTVNEYSRPGTAIDKITGIVVHYTANPGTTAQQNRNYFEGLKDTHTTEVSSNFVIGIEGEIVQCVPTWEVAYASNSRNIDTVSIECCHPDESGVFTDETYRSMVQLCAWLCMKFDLNEKDVIRHYDVTGKNCPKYFVEDEKAWKKFRKDIKAAMEK